MSDITVTNEVGTTAIVTPATPVAISVDGTLRGVAGNQGVQGLTGPAGSTGPQGPAGPTGPAGAKGTFPYFNVQDYGAAGDNTHDDTTSIQNAIVAAAILGGTVFFPPGTYKITSAITMYTGVSFLGEGSEASVIKQYTANADCLYGNDVASITLDQIRLEGPSSTPSGTGRGINFIWTTAGNVPFMNFRDVWVRWFGGTGIAIETPIVSHFDRVLVDKNGAYGFDWYHAGTSCTFTSCWARNNVQAGYHFYQSVYQTLNACAADGNGMGYLIESAQSIDLIACGAESQVIGAGLWDGTGIKISNSSVVGLHNVWLTNNVAVGIWITNGSIACEIFGAADNSPGGGATAFVKTDVSTNTTVSDVHNTTADSYSPGTVTVLNDGANGMLTKQLTVKDTSGSMILTATPDGAGGQFSLQVDTTGILDLFGQGGQTLNVNLLDGYLQLSALTATTVPYLDANKRFVSSAVTPTELGYVSGVTSAIQTQLGTKQATLSLTTTGSGAATLVGATLNIPTPGAAAFTSLTTTGTSGAATLISGVLNIPNYTGLANPMTTLGDIIYENATPAPARLAGSTSATMAVLTQTGNGSISAAPVWTTTTGTGSIVAATSPTVSTLTVSSGGITVTSGNVALSSGFLTVTGANGTLEILSATDGGDFNIFHSATGTKTLALYGSGANIMNLNLLDGVLQVGSNTVISNAGVLSNITLDTAGTAVVLKVNGTSLTAVQGTGAVVLASSPTITTPTISGHFVAEGVTTTGAQGTGALVFATSPTLTTPNIGAATGTSLVLTNTSATGLAVGPNGSTTPILAVDSSTASAVAGLLIKGAATGGTVAISTTDSGAATNLTINAKGTGTIGIGSVSTGTVTITPITTITGALTLGSTINKVTITTPGTSATLTLITGSSLITAGAFALTLTSTAATNSTFPSGTHTLAGLDVVQSWTAVQTFSSAPVFNALPTGTAVASAATASTLASRDANGNLTANLFIEPNQAISVTTNAGTADINHGMQTFTNSSAAAMTITLTTTSATDGESKIVRVYDFSAVAQTITWVNTENSGVSAPTTSNGSTTLPLIVGFIYNSATSKWRCVASV